MIRVNLLPQKRSARTSAPQQSQKWLLLVLAAVVLEIVALFLFHQTKIEELDQQRAKNQRLQSEIDDIKKLVAQHEEIKKVLAQLRAREDAIAKLQTARSGPTAVLLELAQLLTPGRGPTVDRERLEQLKKENPLNVYNAGWDSRRVWLGTYVESQRVVRIEGQARDGTDVSELAIRLRLSPYFYDVQILSGKKSSSGKGPEMVEFSIQMKVRY